MTNTYDEFIGKAGGVFAHILFIIKQSTQERGVELALPTPSTLQSLALSSAQHQYWKYA